MPTSRTPADGVVQGVASSAAAAPSGGKRKRTPSGYEFGSGMRAATGVLGCGHGGRERARGRIAGTILRRSSPGPVDGAGARELLGGKTEGAFVIRREPGDPAWRMSRSLKAEGQYGLCTPPHARPPRGDL